MATPKHNWQQVYFIPLLHGTFKLLCSANPGNMTPHINPKSFNASNITTNLMTLMN